MLVSLAIFIIAAVFAVGALLRITSLNRQAQALQSAMNNLTFALESISREMRVGSNFHCETFNSNASKNWNSFNGASSLTPQSCDISRPAAAASNSDSSIIFFASSKFDSGDPTCRLIYGYLLTPKDSVGPGWSLQKTQQQSCGGNIKYNPGSDNTFSPIIDETNVTLTGFELGVQTQSSAKKYAWAFIRLKGRAGARAQDQHVFDVQTVISERIHD